MVRREPDSEFSTLTGRSFAEALGNFGIEKREQGVAAIHQRDGNAKSHEDGSVFAADDAAADDREAFGNALHLQESVGVESVDVVEGDFGRAMRLGTGGDENDVAAKAVLSIATGDVDGVRVLEGGLAVEKCDLMEREIFEDVLAFHFHHFALVVHEVVYGEIFLERVVDAVEAALLKAGEVQGGFAQRFAGDRAGVDATAAGVLSAFDHGDALAEVGGLRAGFFSRRAAADDQQVKLLVGRHRNLPQLFPDDWREECSLRILR
jgi:hypothetical protein